MFDLPGVIRAALEGSAADTGDKARPVAVLWTDAEGQWLPLMPVLRAAIPGLYALGTYAPSLRTGPAIWLKCIVDRTLPECPAEGVIPILYLPKVARQELRAAGECPAALLPLVELLYRGTVWCHPKSRADWTVDSFLTSEACGLEIAQDRRTLEAMGRALALLGEVALGSLRGRRLEADDFDKLLVADPVRELLRWMSAPEIFEAGKTGSAWESFRNVCRNQFHFDPEEGGPEEAGRQLASGKGAWDGVWMRFSEAPQLYPGVGKLLSAPGDLLALDPSRNPSANEQDEREVRNQLETVGGMAPAAAAAKIGQLEARHGERRGWVWAAMGQSGWAQVLAPLAKLARLAETPVGGTTVEAAAAAYTESGWRVDGLAMEALGQFRVELDRRILGRAIRAVYLPWLEASARHFQELLRKQPGGGRGNCSEVTREKETCLVFVDGLRYDQGVRLAEKLEARSLKVKIEARLSPLPTVTPTAKPGASPVSGEAKGTSTGDDFLPVLETKNGPRGAQAGMLWDRMAAQGVDAFEAGETPFPTGDGGGWTECGKIDSLGHKLQGELPLHLDNEVERIANRVAELLESGWKKIRVVTDHGWLLVPEGLPKVELPAYLTGTKWARCAVIRGEEHPAVVSYGWHWNPEVRVVSPPGVASFFAGETYTHGGVSPQECVVPELVVTGGAAVVRATIQVVQWRGMRCRVKVESTDATLRVDLRTQWKQAGTSIVAAVKELGAGGEVSLAVADDDRMGDPAVVVLLDAAGSVLDRMTTSIGETA